MLSVQNIVSNDNKIRIFFLLGVLLFGFALASLFYSDVSKATSIDPDLEIKVDEVLELSLTNCDTTNSSVVAVDVIPTTAGTFKSNCQTASVNTNAPGYALSIKSSSSTLNYQNPTTVTPTPTIASTSNTIASPQILTNDTWGFGVEDRLNFGSGFSTNEASNIYAQLPTTDTTIYSTTTWPLPEKDHEFYYATRLTPITMAGTYMTTVTYTAIGQELIPPQTTCKNAGTAPECIVFTVDTTADGTYSIPTSGRVANTDHTYDWNVYVDGYLTDACTNGNCTGTSSITSSGVTLTGLADGQHQILIVPHNSPEPGWGNAFGHYNEADGANASINKQKLISLDAPFTTFAFVPKTTESTTNASYLFANLFHDCSNLTTTMQIENNYTLPSTITSFANFLFNTHFKNSNLQTAIDLTPLANLFNSNTTITNLSSFMVSTHSLNTSLQSPIDLSPLKDWFRSNNSIINLYAFFAFTHSASPALQSPMDLTPLKDWFNGNTSITNLAHFLTGAHNGNLHTNFIAPLDLSPLKDWFKSNNSITNLSSFLSATHVYSQSLLDPIDLTPLENWFNANTSITNLSNFLYSTHESNYMLSSSIDLTPLENWFVNNNSITNLSFFLCQTHVQNNFNLRNPINLASLANWFNSNTSISNMSYFLASTHYGNGQLTTLMDVTPLSNWFVSNRKVTTLSQGFMYRTHYSNNNITLSNQKILPNWIKTMTNDDNVLVWDTGTNCGDGENDTQQCSFYQTFYTLTPRVNDTGEIRFEDDSVLSSVGEPSKSLETYNGRTNISPLNNTNGRWRSD